MKKFLIKFITPNAECTNIIWAKNKSDAFKKSKEENEKALEPGSNWWWCWHDKNIVDSDITGILHFWWSPTRERPSEFVLYISTKLRIELRAERNSTSGRFVVRLYVNDTYISTIRTETTADIVRAIKKINPNYRFDRILNKIKSPLPFRNSRYKVWRVILLQETHKKL